MKMLQNTVTGVVLLTEDHVPFFIEMLIPNLNQLSRPFDEIIIVASGLNFGTKRKVKHALSRILNHARVNLLIVTLGSVGRNRNIGIRASTSFLTTFLDSDDLYRPDYVEFIERAYGRTPFDIMLHSGFFLDVAEREFDFGNYSTDDSLAIEALQNKDFTLRTDINWETSPEQLDDTGLWQTNSKWVILQGHMTIRTKAPIRFHENPLARNEDGVFLNQALITGLRIVFYPANLSVARVGSSSRPLVFRFLKKLKDLL